jgi:hypothetical protein
MSWDVELRGENGVCTVDHEFCEGGTHAAWGTNECELNVTYNYSVLFRLAWAAAHVYGDRPINPATVDKGFMDWLHGRQAKDTAALLLAMRAELTWGIKTDTADYWTATPGNAAKALERLSIFAHQNPDGWWHVT